MAAKFIVCFVCSSAGHWLVLPTGIVPRVVIAMQVLGLSVWLAFVNDVKLMIALWATMNLMGYGLGYVVEYVVCWLVGRFYLARHHSSKTAK